MAVVLQAERAVGDAFQIGLVGSENLRLFAEFTVAPQEHVAADFADDQIQHPPAAAAGDRVVSVQRADLRRFLPGDGPCGGVDRRNCASRVVQAHKFWRLWKNRCPRTGCGEVLRRGSWLIAAAKSRPRRDAEMYVCGSSPGGASPNRKRSSFGACVARTSRSLARLRLGHRVHLGHGVPQSFG